MDRIELDQANRLMTQLAAQFNIDDLAFSREGTCVIKIDDKLDIFIEVSSDTNDLRIYGAVADLHFVSEKNLWQQLLVENLPSKKMGHCYYAINAKSEKLLLCTQIGMYRLEYTHFTERLETFVNYFEFALEIIKKQAVRSNPQPVRDNVQSSLQSSSIQRSYTQSKLFTQLK